MLKILIYASNSIGTSMAGPAIRSLELSKALSVHHQVTLICPNQPDLTSQLFTIVSKKDLDQKEAFERADVLITQSLTPLMALQAKRHGLSIIIDAYDPIPLESLEQFKHEQMNVRKKWQNSSINHLIFSFKMADAILCASEKQRDLWIGFLLGQKLISPERYDADNSLRTLIDVVPFGLSSEKPQKKGVGLKEKYQFAPEDKIILWGGGIWNWFDPLSLIKAMKLLYSSRPEIKLVFMGIKNPEPSVPEMEMGRKAIALAENLELLDRTVFFNAGWIPYDQRENYLLDASLGASIHFDHLETRYSFRTRMLDYIWAELPILATEGDSFAELIQQKNLGFVVSYEDEQAIATAITQCLDDPLKQKTIKKNLRELQPLFYWNHVVKPIERMILSFSSKPRPYCKRKDYLTIVSFILNQIKAKGFKKTLQLVKRKFFNSK